MPAPTPEACATPGCCRCSSISPVTATGPATRTPVGLSRRRCQQLQNDDLVPYRTLVTAAAPVGVMVGHLQVPELTGNDPASLSRAAVQLLRTGTGYNGPAFDGPVFTDDLSSMAAIKDRYSVPDAVLRALQAGNDVALWVTTDEVPAVLDRSGEGSWPQGS